MLLLYSVRVSRVCKESGVVAVFVSLWLPPAYEVILEKAKLPENPGLGASYTLLISQATVLFPTVT